MKKIALVIAVLMFCACFTSCESKEKFSLGFYQIDKAQEFNEYSTIGITLEEDGVCTVDFSMTGDCFSGTYAVKGKTLTLALDTLYGEYIDNTEIDLTYKFDILSDGKLVFKEYVGESIKYTYNITGEEMSLKESMHFEKGSRFILQNEENNPSFKAKVLEVYDFSILVEPLEDEKERKSSDKISIDLPYELIENDTKFAVDDIVSVVYNGQILETYPAQLGQIFDVLLLD